MLAGAHQWLDAVPVIAFQTVRTRPVKDMLESRVPLDHWRTPREEIPMTPELLEHVRAMLRDHYMKWLDMAIPMFGGRPRARCAKARTAGNESPC